MHSAGFCSSRLNDPAQSRLIIESSQLSDNSNVVTCIFIHPYFMALYVNAALLVCPENEYVQMSPFHTGHVCVRNAHAVEWVAKLVYGRWATIK